MNANDAEDWRELWSLDMPERVSLAVIRCPTAARKNLDAIRDTPQRSAVRQL